MRVFEPLGLLFEMCKIMYSGAHKLTNVIGDVVIPYLYSRQLGLVIPYTPRCSDGSSFSQVENVLLHDNISLPHTVTVPYVSSVTGTNYCCVPITGSCTGWTTVTACWLD